MSEGLSQKQRIALLKERCASERVLFSAQAEALLPMGKKLAGAGVVLMKLKKSAPAIKAFTLAWAHRSLAKHGVTGWLKVGGVVALGVGAARMLAGRNRE